MHSKPDSITHYWMRPYPVESDDYTIVAAMILQKTSAMKIDGTKTPDDIDWQPPPFQWGDWVECIWRLDPREPWVVLKSDIGDFHKEWLQRRGGTKPSTVLWVCAALFPVVLIALSFTGLFPPEYGSAVFLVFIIFGIGWIARNSYLSRGKSRTGRNLPRNIAHLLEPAYYRNEVLCDLWLSTVKGSELVAPFAHRKRAVFKLIAMLYPFCIAGLAGFVWLATPFDITEMPVVVWMIIWLMWEIGLCYIVGSGECPEINELIMYWEKRTGVRYLMLLSDPRFHAEQRAKYFVYVLLAIAALLFTLLELGPAFICTSITAIIALRLLRPIIAWERQVRLLQYLWAADQVFDDFVRGVVIGDDDALRG